MSDDEVNNEALEEERLMRAMSRQGRGGGRSIVSPRAAPAAAAAPEEKKVVDKNALPAWKVTFPPLLSQMRVLLQF